MSNFCPECGINLEGNFKFCPNCGFELSNVKKESAKPEKSNKDTKKKPGAAKKPVQKNQTKILDIKTTAIIILGALIIGLVILILLRNI